VIVTSLLGTLGRETIEHVKTIVPKELNKSIAILEEAGTKFKVEADEVATYIHNHKVELGRDVLVPS
jgi:flagellar biosynthesis/type III secretory pathway ATPase